MRRLFFALFLVVAAIMPANADTHKQFENSVYKLENADGGTATTFHIGDGLFVTSKHVLRGINETMLLNSDGAGVSAKLVHSFTEYDLAILQVSDNALSDSSLKLDCSPPVRGEPVSSIGFPSPLSYISTYGFVSSDGFIENLLPLNFVMDMTISSGQSGSPVLDKTGKAIGIISGVLRDHNSKQITGYSIAVSTAPICEYLSVS